MKTMTENDVAEKPIEAVATEVSTEMVKHDKVNVLLDNADSLQNLFTSGRLAELSKMDKNPMNLSMQYFDFVLGEPQRFVFVGVTEAITQDGGLMPAVVLINEKGDPFVNQAALLVDTFRKNNIPLNTAVEVTWTGTKKTGNNFQVRTWRVNLLS